MTDTSLAEAEPLDFLAFDPPADPNPLGSESVVVPPGTTEAPAAPADTPPDVPPAPPASPAGHVPLAALLDEREKRQSIEREHAALRAKQAPPLAPPSITSDPEAWAKHQEAEQQAFRDETRLEFSGRAAETVHGAETVQAAMAWGQEVGKNDPTMQSRFMMQQDPYGWLVAEYRKDQNLTKLADKTPDDFAAEWAKSNGWTPPAEQQPAGGPPNQATSAQTPQAPAAPAKPSPSIARAPGAGTPAAPALIAEKDLVNGLWE